MIKAKWWIYQIGIPLVLLYAFPWVFNNAHTIHVAQTFLITYIVIVGLNLLVGLSNQLSLGHVGFYAIGAYLSVILTMKVGLNFFVSIIDLCFSCCCIWSGCSSFVLTSERSLSGNGNNCIWRIG